MKRKILFLTVSLMLLLSFVLSGCGNSVSKNASNSSEPSPKATTQDNSENNKPKTPVTINFLTDTRSEWTKIAKLLPDFEKETGIKVNIVTLSETDLRSKTVLELTSPKTDFDVMMLDFTTMPKYMKSNLLSPLTGYDEKSFYKPFLDALASDGKQYGMPLYQDTNVLVYRADLFEQLNLKVPDTFKELEEVAAKLTDKKKDMYGIALRGQRGYGLNEWTFSSWLHGYGGSQMDASGNPTINSPEAVQALTDYAKLVNNYSPPGAASFSYVEVQNLMATGKVGMIIDSASLIPRFEDPSQSTVSGKLGYAMVPKGVNRSTGFYTWSVSIPTHATHKEEANKFINWVLSSEVSKKLGLSAPTAALEVAYNVKPYKTTTPLIDVMKESLKLAEPDYRPRTDNAEVIGENFSIAISKAITGDDPKKVLDAANVKIQDSMKK